jgi:hypothetical protein
MDGTHKKINHNLYGERRACLLHHYFLAWLEKNQKIFHEQVPALARASVKTLN